MAAVLREHLPGKHRVGPVHVGLGQDLQGGQVAAMAVVQGLVNAWGVEEEQGYIASKRNFRTLTS